MGWQAGKGDKAHCLTPSMGNALCPLSVAPRTLSVAPTDSARGLSAERNAHRLKCCQYRGIEPTQGRGVRTTPASTRGHMWMGARTRTHELFGAIRSYSASYLCPPRIACKWQATTIFLSSTRRRLAAEARWPSEALGSPMNAAVRCVRGQCMPPFACQSFADTTAGDACCSSAVKWLRRGTAWPCVVPRARRSALRRYASRSRDLLRGLSYADASHCVVYLQVQGGLGGAH